MSRNLIAALALLAAPLAATPAQSALRPAAVEKNDRVIAAGKALAIELEAMSDRNAPVLDLRKPAVAALFRDTFDLDAIRDLSTDPMTVMGTLQSLLAAYQAFHRFASGDGANTGRVLQVQDEAVTATIVIILVSKRTYSAAGLALRDVAPEDRNDIQREGVRQMHAGFLLMLEGGLLLQTDPGITAANRTRMIDGVVEELGLAAEAMDPASRAKARALLLRYAGTANAANGAKLRQAARLFERTDCATLCSFG